MQGVQGVQGSRRISFAAVIVALGVAICPGPALATVTIGSDLARAPTGSDSVPEPAGRTWALTGTQAGGVTAPGGVSSPVNGTVTAWRIRAGQAASAVSFRVLHPVPPGSPAWTGAGTSASVVPAPNATSTYPASLPIARGDFIGINCCGGGIASYYFAGPHFFSLPFGPPPLADGGPPRQPDFAESREITINADIAPTSAFEIVKVKKLSKGRLKVRASLPNPGTLVAGDRRDKKTAASAAARKAGKKRKLLKRRRVAVDEPGELTFRVKPTKFARKRLKAKAVRTGRKRVKIKVGLRLAFTPLFGASRETETERTTIRR